MTARDPEGAAPAIEVGGWNIETDRMCEGLALSKAEAVRPENPIHGAR